MQLTFDTVSFLDHDSHIAMETSILPFTSLSLTHICARRLRGNTQSSIVSATTKTPYTLNTAEYCKHYLHPGTPQTEFLCPDCKIKQRLNDLHTMAKLWERRGARTPDYNLLDEDEVVKAREAYFWYWKTYKAWREEKLCLIKYTSFLELWAERERLWEAEHPGALHGMERCIESASQALITAKRGTPYLDWKDTDADGMRPPPREGVKRVRWVRFQEDIVGRPKRDLKAFRRTEKQYVPGGWALPEGEGYWNTSFAYEVRYGTEEFEKGLDDEWERGAGRSGISRGALS
ncbi:hypothetical protein K458DRAFT_381420 [Lentithecium fluviatile CBS 122367]|uniref:Uncharacterized protein n=1 Tax=Lentithecium fluviatile CBS 122367 TaxID=1168545 RepID=A0A6G1JN37_9PLEO|nr:hypothetical protein K458DRAFT_381420 [Lentithecium fluviatile CBS 122367]